jgi:hypothetical protein
MLSSNLQCSNSSQIIMSGNVSKPMGQKGYTIPIVPESLNEIEVHVTKLTDDLKAIAAQYEDTISQITSNTNQVAQIQKDAIQQLSNVVGKSFESGNQVPIVKFNNRPEYRFADATYTDR